MESQRTGKQRPASRTPSVFIVSKITSCPEPRHRLPLKPGRRYRTRLEDLTPRSISWGLQVCQRLPTGGADPDRGACWAGQVEEHRIGHMDGVASERQGVGLLAATRIAWLTRDSIRRLESESKAEGKPAHCPQ